MLQKLMFVLNLLRGVPAWLVLGLSGEKDLIRRETEGYRWFFDEEQPRSFFAAFQLLLWKYPPYRNQVIFRCAAGSRIASYGIRLLYPPKKDLELSGTIGEGLVIFHGHGAVIGDCVIGRNFRVYQGVTIGKNRTPGRERLTPVIGDDVAVYTGAVVAGGITVGSGCSIGANAVVLRDVPKDCLVYGNPCVIREKKDGKEISEKCK